MDPVLRNMIYNGLEQARRADDPVEPFPPDQRGALALLDTWSPHLETRMDSTARAERAERLRVASARREDDRRGRT